MIWKKILLFLLFPFSIIAGFIEWLKQPGWRNTHRFLMMDQEGCLFLFDEPDTHFNPKWRAKLIETLNYITATSINENGKITHVRNQEIVITTHSPFVISDSFTKDVYRFQKKDGVISYENPEFKTYGASISIILEEIFEKEESISEMAVKNLSE